MFDSPGIDQQFVPCGTDRTANTDSPRPILQFQLPHFGTCQRYLTLPLIEQGKVKRNHRAEFTGTLLAAQLDSGPQ